MANTDKKRPLLFVSVGVILGLLDLLLQTHSVTKALNHLLSPTSLFVSFTGFITLFTYNGKHTARLLAWSGLLSALIAGLYYITLHANQLGIFDLSLIQIVAIYAAICLLQSYHQSDYQQPDYTVLFANVWTNCSLMIFVLVFVALVDSVLFLWGTLFAAIDINVFRNFFDNPLFTTLTRPIIYATGLYLSFQSKHTIYNLRTLTLSFFKILLPAIPLIGISYLIAISTVAILYPLHILDKASTIGGQSLCYVILGIIFINAVYQDGTHPPTSRLYRLSMDVLIYLLPLLCLLSLFTLFVCAPQPSLNKNTAELFLILLLCLGYTGFYLTGILQPKKEWLSTLKTGNTTLAWVLIAIVFLLATPPFYRLFPKAPKTHSQHQLITHKHRA